MRSSSCLAAGALATLALALPASASAADMTFTRHQIPTQSLGWDLYEPSVFAAGADGQTKAIYFAAHSEAAFTTRAPGWVSNDGGNTWAQLPGLLPKDPVTPIPTGGGHATGDEGIIVADHTGRAWQFDNGAGQMPMYSFCGDGGAECGYQPNVYDFAAAASSDCQTGGDDRPWHAYGNNKVLLVNNGFVGTNSKNVAQVGLFDTTTQTATWNMCAHEGWIPGVPSMRDSDGEEAVPQISGDVDDNGDFQPKALTLLRGPDPFHLAAEDLWGTKVTDFACSSNFGWASYSNVGNLFAMSATDERSITVGALIDGKHWQRTAVPVHGPIQFLWLSASQSSRDPKHDGALVTWAEPPSGKKDDCGAANFYAAHVVLKGGGLSVKDVSLVAANQDAPCGDYHGSSLGPDGKAYVAIETGGCLGDPTAKQIAAWIQTGGPTLP